MWILALLESISRDTLMVAGGLVAGVGAVGALLATLVSDRDWWDQPQ